MGKTAISSSRTRPQASPASRPAWRLWLAVALGTLAASAAAAAAPVPVTHSLSIRHGDWIPLPTEDMRRAAADPALARLSDAGRLEILSPEAAARRGAGTGELKLEIALVGPAETAKLTMTLDVPGSPTLVSTASITVRGLDHGGIYRAFEHVGQRAADRLVAKLDLLSEARAADAPPPARLESDAARRRAYEAAQAQKRAGDYARARASFEALVASAADPKDPVAQLSDDELRFGLPLFEAQQALNELGRLSLPGQQAAREAALTRAENLYRQIQAENPSSIERVAGAQRALDSLIVTRGALANAMRAQTRTYAHSIRIAFFQEVMMEGRCPDRPRAESLLADLRVPLLIEEVLAEPTDGTTRSPGLRYRFRDAGRSTWLDLVCTQDHVEIVESPRDGRPAARP